MNSDQIPADTSAPNSASLPTALLRDGWMPHRFPNSDIVIVLPKARIVKFGENGALYASFTRSQVDFTATLHTNPKFKNQRELALEFVSNLAKKKNAEIIDVATYRYFADPKVAIEKSREHSFWVIGIPSAVVVVSLTRDVGSPFPPELESIRLAIPRIIGELL